MVICLFLGAQKVRIHAPCGPSPLSGPEATWNIASTPRCKRCKGEKYSKVPIGQANPHWTAFFVFLQHPNQPRTGQINPQIICSSITVTTNSWSDPSTQTSRNQWFQTASDCTSTPRCLLDWGPYKPHQTTDQLGVQMCHWSSQFPKSTFFIRCNIVVIYHRYHSR